MNNRIYDSDVIVANNQNYSFAMNGSQNYYNGAPVDAAPSQYMSRSIATGAKAQLYLISNREMSDQLIRPNHFNTSDSVIDAISSRVRDKVSGGVAARRMSLGNCNPTACADFIFPGSDCTVAQTSTYSCLWTYLLVVKYNRAGVEAQETFVGVVGCDYGSPIGRDGSIDTRAKLLPHRHTYTKPAKYAPGDGRVWVDCLADNVVVRSNDRAAVTSNFTNDLFGVNYSSVLSDCRNNAQFGRYDTSLATEPAMAKKPHLMPMDDVAPYQQVSRLVDGLSDEISCHVNDYSSPSIFNDYSSEEIISRMATVDRNRHSVSTMVPDDMQLNPSTTYTIGEIDAAMGGSLHVTVLNIPYANCMDLSLQDANDRRSVFSAILAQTIPALACRYGLSDIVFRYDSLDASADFRVAPPDERGVYRIESFGTLQQLDDNSKVALISAFMKQLITNVFPSIRESGGDFSLLVFYDHTTRTLINLNFFDDTGFNPDFVEYQSSLLGITTPSLGSHKNLIHNTEAITRVIDGVANNVSYDVNNYHF